MIRYLANILIMIVEKVSEYVGTIQNYKCQTFHPNQFFCGNKIPILQ